VCLFVFFFFGGGGGGLVGSKEIEGGIQLFLYLENEEKMEGNESERKKNLLGYQKSISPKWRDSEGKMSAFTYLLYTAIQQLAFSRKIKTNLKFCKFSLHFHPFQIPSIQKTEEKITISSITFFLLIYCAPKH
jgi:hypothetical protein